MSTHDTLYDEDHVEFRSMVRRFVDTELRPRAEEFRANRQIPRSVWKQAGDLGLLGFMMPEEFGGGGVSDFRFNAVLGEELSRLGYAYASSFGINTDVVAPYLQELATPEQQKRWLPAFCRGELITAIALTEPGTGSDLAAVTTRATPTADGWSISGAKTFITNGAQCDLVLAVVRTGDAGGSKGLSLFAFETTRPGFTRGRKLDKIGQHEADASELSFDDLRVTRDDLIGEEGAAFGYLMRNLAQERLSCAIAALAQGDRIFELTLEYVKERRAFGTAIGSFQHNKFALAQARTDLDVTRAFLERCLGAHVRGELTGADAAKVKLVTTELQGRLADLGVQMFGGYGYMNESEIARCWADARVTRIFAGTSEIMREVVGRSLGL